MRDSAYGVTTEEEARDVRELAAHKADMVKIFGSTTATARWKSSRPTSTAPSSTRPTMISGVMAHVFALDDVKALVRAGIDGFAHMVRDKDVDDELIALLKQRPDVFFVATLWGERRALYAGKPGLGRRSGSAPGIRD